MKVFNSDAEVIKELRRMKHEAIVEKRSEDDILTLAYAIAFLKIRKKEVEDIHRRLSDKDKMKEYLLHCMTWEIAAYALHGDREEQFEEDIERHELLMKVFEDAKKRAEQKHEEKGEDDGLPE